MIVYVIVGRVMFLAVPNFEQTFKDFKMELPGLTKLLLLFARWFRGIGWLLLMPVPVVIPYAINKLIPPPIEPKQNRHWRIAGVTSIVLLAIGILMLMALWLPVLGLMEAISPPRRP